MGTLTADQTRLPEQCVHKLPTSCRLSSIPECCACADERAHSAAYSTYIDGVGYVLRGTRWQRYCWFCKEFWENRITTSGLRPGQTRIPETPDQTAFLERWYDFHRGYRIVVQENGDEEKIAVIGEDFKDVSPGQLPRTVEELRQGLERSTFEHALADTTSAALPTANDPSLSTELDLLFQVAQVEEDVANQPTVPRLPSPSQPVRSNIHAQAMTTSRTRINEREMRRAAALRRELSRMRNGIERVIAGLRELGQPVSDQHIATGRLESLGRTLDDITGSQALEDQQPGREAGSTTNTDRPLPTVQSRVDEARSHLDEARRMHTQAAAELRTAEQEVRVSQRRLQQLQREQRTAENYMRLFGTREEVIAQGDNYESPIGGMFNRAWERFRVAEGVRQEERTLRHVLADEGAGDQAASDNRGMDGDAWDVRNSGQRGGVDRGLSHQNTSNTTQLMEMARDAVFSGDSFQHPADTGGAMNLEPQDENEEALSRYYNTLRRQGWRQDDNDLTHGAPFLQNMLNARSSRLAARTAIFGNPTVRIAEPDAASSLAAQSSLPFTRVYVLDYTTWLQDAEFLLRKLTQDSNGQLTRLILGYSEEQASLYAAMLQIVSVHENRSRVIPRPSFDEINDLFANDELVWTSRLPAEWLRRARAEGNPILLTEDPRSNGREEQRQNIEAMAEAYQMSAEVRSTSHINVPEQLRLLYRLQHGERNASDRHELWIMLRSAASVPLARRVLVSQATGPTAAEASHISALQRERVESSRTGQFSRQELHSLRQNTSALALAARQAGSQDGIQRMIDMHAEMRDEARQPGIARAGGDHELVGGLLAHARRGASHLLDVSTESETDEEDDGASNAVGLDATSSGRPDPKSDEEMTVKLECHICFTQLADIACLPCGHLVMCKWCSEQHSPVSRQDRTRPRRPAACPACRKQIKQKVRVFRM